MNVCFIQIITDEHTLWFRAASKSVHIPPLQPVVMSAYQICGTHTWWSVNSLSGYCFWSHTQNIIAATSYYGITLITFHSGYWVHTI